MHCPCMCNSINEMAKKYTVCLVFIEGALLVGVMHAQWRGAMVFIKGLHINVLWYNVSWSRKIIVL